MATSTQQRADSGQSERVELAARDAIALRAYELFERAKTRTWTRRRRLVAGGTRTEPQSQ